MKALHIAFTTSNTLKRLNSTQFFFSSYLMLAVYYTINIMSSATRIKGLLLSVKEKLIYLRFLLAL